MKVWFFVNGYGKMPVEEVELIRCSTVPEDYTVTIRRKDHREEVVPTAKIEFIYPILSGYLGPPSW